MNPMQGIAYGFSVALLPENLIAALVGALLGTLTGVLPGIGPVGAMALLLSATMAFRPETALIMMAGVYYGSQYGGLHHLYPDQRAWGIASVVSCVDGYQMAKKGKAGVALAVAAVGSLYSGHSRGRGVDAICTTPGQLCPLFRTARVFFHLSPGTVHVVHDLWRIILERAGYYGLRLCAGLNWDGTHLRGSSLHFWGHRDDAGCHAGSRGCGSLWPSRGAIGSRAGGRIALHTQSAFQGVCSQAFRSGSNRCHRFSVEDC